MLETARRWIIQMGACVVLAAVSSAAMAQTTTAIYELDNVWLLPDVTRPWDPAQQMTGNFEWVYQVGDFENGAGQFNDLIIPWSNPSIGELNINIDVGSIEMSLPGNFHDLGVDITLFLSDPLTPDQPSAINTVTSQFEIQNGVILQGRVLSGNIIHVPQLVGDLNGDGFMGVDDLNIVLVNWNQNVTPGDFLLGDPSGDGFVGVDDLNFVLANWNAGTPPPGDALALVPEPTAGAVWVCGMMLLRRRGRRVSAAVAPPVQA